MNHKTQSNIVEANTEQPVLVSVIIPCYNHEKFIERTLNSVVADTYLNKEIMIINDGSKDNSDSVIRQWISIHEKTVAVFYINRSNKGICATINELVDKAKGKYILTEN